MKCKDCVRFDGENNRCKDHKINPLNWETSVTVAQIQGIRSICVFNVYRERLIETIISPKSRP
ncbi:MAG: hypothetical protein NTU72_00690 [Fimbriimonadales bacterium]|nr:hypothetical protein [Fimbriimonadales bacterium]